MSRIASNKSVRLDLGDGEWVDIRENLPYRDIESIATTGEKEGGTKALLEQMAELFRLAIKDWHLLDADGVAVPYSVEKLKELDMGTTKAIQNFIVKQYELEDVSKKN